MLKKVLMVVGILLALLTTRFVMLGSESRNMKVNLGTTSEYNLKPCMSQMNCVESKSSSDSEFQPLTVKSNPIPDLVKAMKARGMKIVLQKETYVHAIEKSAIFGFVDDTEFLYRPDLGLLFYRSSSRVGKSDLGANGKRINELIQKIL